MCNRKQKSFVSRPSPTDRGPVWSHDTVLTCEYYIPSYSYIYMYVYTECVSILQIRDCVNELGNVLGDTHYKPVRGGTAYRTVNGKQNPKWKQLACIHVRIN